MSSRAAPLAHRPLPMMAAAPQRFGFGAFANHRNTEDNLEETPFEFTAESYAAIEQLLPKYPDNYKSSAIIPVLFIAQKQNKGIGNEGAGMQNSTISNAAEAVEYGVAHVGSIMQNESSRRGLFCNPSKRNSWILERH